LIALALPALQAGLATADEPVIVDDKLVFPEGANIPRYMTEAEKRWLLTHPIAAPRAVTPAPTGAIQCVAEYEPMEGLLFAWEQFNGSSTTILPTMIKHITTTGAGKAYVVVDTASEQTTANTTLSSAGANLANVQYIVRTTDTVWIRDYGPRYIYQGQCRAITDHTYNRPRPNDDVLPSYFGTTVKKHAFYEHQLTHGGGNYHLDANDRSYATELIWNENPGLTHTQIHDIWQSYQNVDTHIFPPFPTSVDSTQHLDMWMQVISDNKVIIADWPYNVGSTQDIICDDAAVYMAGQGYTVYRITSRSLTSHYTFTNMVMFNDVILLPTFTNTGITAAPNPPPSGGGTINLNTEALNVVAAALPGKTIIQVNCEAMISSAGVMHCIVMHVPKHLGSAGGFGGLAPTAYLKNLRGGEVLTPGANVDIQWISDDDVSVSNVDVLLSTNSGASYNTTIASATADDGTQTWNVPSIYTPNARIKVVARDAPGNTGFDASPANFTINGTPLLGDVNCDGYLNAGDAEAFAQALIYQTTGPGCGLGQADLNGDTKVDGKDVPFFLDMVGL
jgi:agmatine/peptidylarginine deiminase